LTGGLSDMISSTLPCFSVRMGLWGEVGDDMDPPPVVAAGMLSACLCVGHTEHSFICQGGIHHNIKDHT